MKPFKLITFLLQLSLNDFILQVNSDPPHSIPENITKQKGDSFAFMKDGIMNCLNDDTDDDSNRFFPISDSNKYRSLNKLVGKITIVSITSSSIKGISQMRSSM